MFHSCLILTVLIPYVALHCLWFECHFKVIQLIIGAKNQLKVTDLSACYFILQFKQKLAHPRIALSVQAS